jgi:type I restriction enzyme S subunit
MNDLEKLIQELCPQGVSYVEIGTSVNYEQPTKYIVNSTKYDDTYKTPVLTAGQTFVLGYTDETQGIYPASKENPVIIFDDFTGAFKWVDFPFKVKSSAMKILTANEEKAMLRYVYHFMGALNFTSDEHKRLWIATYSKFKMPLPPLPVQREIVRILDNFTELTAELTMRKKQYEYYREKLLKKSSNAVQKKFGDIFDFQNGFAFKSNLFKDSGDAILRITNIQESRILTNNIVFFDKSDYKENLSPYLVRKGDIVVAMSGATTGKIGVNRTSTNYYLNQRVGKFVPKKDIVLNRYLYHLLLQNSEKIYAISQGGAQPNLSSEKLKSLTALIPPISEQEQVIEILDRYDSFCNDITIGLPAEIKARKNQYEYYRDKLLTFKELNNCE